MQQPGRSGPILVVEDDQDIREMLTMILEEADYTVVPAIHGHDALTQLQAGVRPGVILLDVLMPVMSGAEFRVAQLQDATLAEIPVIMLSAHLRNLAGDLFAGMQFFQKPIDIRGLLAHISEIYQPGT